MKDIVEFIKEEKLANDVNVLDYLKKTFGKVTVTKNKNAEIDNVFCDDDCDWYEYAINGYEDYPVIVYYTPQSNHFSFSIDYIYAKLNDSGKAEFNSAFPFEENGFLKELSKYDKESVNNLIKVYIKTDKDTIPD